MLAVFVAALAAGAFVGDLRLPGWLVHVVKRRILVDEGISLAASLRRALEEDVRLFVHRAAPNRLSATGNTMAVSTLLGGLGRSRFDKRVGLLLVAAVLAA